MFSLACSAIDTNASILILYKIGDIDLGVDAFMPNAWFLNERKSTK